MLNTYHNAIRTHVTLLAKRARFDSLIAWQVGLHETHDPTLIAQRVYGRRDDADVVMVCAGTNRIGEPLPNRLIYLPKPADLVALKRRHINTGLFAEGGG